MRLYSDLPATATTFDPDWLVPDWPAPAHVRAVCTTRAGGVSGGTWALLNLGSHVGDHADAVAANRSRLRDATGAEAVFLRQVHGVGAVNLDGPVPTEDAWEADACSTAIARRACTIMVADCLPVLLTDRAGRRVGAAHAGWRGLAGGVLESLVEDFRTLVPGASRDDTDDLVAWLGPCIGPTAFEVGGEVRAAFVGHDADAADCFSRRAGTTDKWLANLPALARRRLATAGVGNVYGNDGSEAWCTVAQPLRFFSHRRDAARLGSTGRMAACIWLA